MADSGEKTEAFRGEFVEFSCFPPLTIGLGNTIIDGRPGRGNFSPVIGILAETYQGETIPSRPFVEGGIHEAIMEYENNVFFDILAEDLARRDMNDAPIDESNYAELTHRIEAYINEIEENGTDNILVDIDIAP